MSLNYVGFDDDTKDRNGIYKVERVEVFCMGGIKKVGQIMCETTVK